MGDSVTDGETAHRSGVPFARRFPALRNETPLRSTSRIDDSGLCRDLPGALGLSSGPSGNRLHGMPSPGAVAGGRAASPSVSCRRTRPFRSRSTGQEAGWLGGAAEDPLPEGVPTFRGGTPGRDAGGPAPVRSPPPRGGPPRTRTRAPRRIPSEGRRARSRRSRAPDPLKNPRENQMSRATATSFRSGSSRSWPSGRLTNDTRGSGSSSE